MEEQPQASYIDVPKPVERHPWAIWLWLAPVIAVSVTPVLVVLVAALGAFWGIALPGEAWQLGSMALGIVSGILVGVGAAQAARP